MSERILQPEFRPSLENTKYPFSDKATLVNDGGVFIPETTFLDAALHPVGGTVGLYLSQVVVTQQEVRIVIGDSTTATRAYGSFTLLSPPDVLPLFDYYGRAAGVLVSEANRLAIFQTWGTGAFSFEQDQTEFVASCCIPTPEIGLRGFLLDDGTLVTGDVWFVGGAGIVLSAQEAVIPAGVGGTARQVLSAIRIDVVGDPLFNRRLGTGLFVAPRHIKTITVKDASRSLVCSPDQYGDFKLTVGNQDAEDSILRIRSTAQGLLIEVVGEKLNSIR